MQSAYKFKGPNIGPSLNKFRKDNVQTDVIFDVSGTKMPAHKLVLSAASDYFNNLFFSPGFKAPDVTVPVGGISSDNFQIYLDYAYGNSVHFDDWRTAAEFYRFVDYTQTKWETKDQDLVNFDVPTEDYVEYLHLLIDLYHGNVPVKVIQKSANFIQGYVDLSGLDAGVIKTITDSSDFDPPIDDRKNIYQNLVDKGYDYNEIAGIEEKLTPNVNEMIEKNQPLTVRIYTFDGGIIAKGKTRQTRSRRLLLIRRAESVRLTFSDPEHNSKLHDVLNITRYTASESKVFNTLTDLIVHEYSVLI